MRPLGTRRRARRIFPSLLRTLFGAFLFVFVAAVWAQNRIDVIRPDAPELAKYGERAVGVRALELVHRNQIDMVKLEAQVAEGEAREPDHGGEPTGGSGSKSIGDSGERADLPRYDRPLPVEIWYPAVAGGEPTSYQVFLRDGETRVDVIGRATRDAEPDRTGAPYPLVIISHGYPGNRFLLSHLGENLASKGYVVASIDHTDSTYRTRAGFSSTLVNRPLDQSFALDEVARLSSLSGQFLNGLVDSRSTGLIGYSMGGYGAMITAGGGVTADAVARGAPLGTLGIHLSGSAEHEQKFDPRFKAIVAFAPWGMKAGIWDAAGLAGVRVPILFVAGSVDDISGYEGGVRSIFEQAIHVDRYLLTFDNANHNAAAPMPAPAESFVARDGMPAPFFHYADPVWDTARMNNIAQHFVTAYFGRMLKGDRSMDSYLDLVPRSSDGVWATDENGEPKPEHTYWKGFENRTAVGLRCEKLAAEK